MQGVITLLCGVGILIPFFFAWRNSISKHGVEVNHVLLLSIGFEFYLIFPVVIGQLRLFYDYPAMHTNWYKIFDTIPKQNLVLYLCFVIGFYLSFCLGDFVSKRVFRNVPKQRELFFDKRILNVYLVIGVLIASALAYVNRDILFRGYTGGVDPSVGIGLRGSFMAAASFLLSLAFVYATKRERDYLLKGVPAYHLSFSRMMSNKYVLIYIVVGILVLSMGGRLYFFSSVAMFFIYRTVYFQRIKLRTAIITGVVLIVAVAIYGALRVGKLTFDTEGFMTYVVFHGFFVESLYNAFSIIAFVRAGQFDMLNFPIPLLSYLVNLVPTALVPDKAKLFISLEDTGYVVYSPVGGFNVFPSSMINFGIMGTCFFWFFLGFFMFFLKEKRKTVLFKTMYIMIAGWLLTTFYRDPFSVSLIKSVFQFSILMPIFFVVGAHSITTLLVKPVVKSGYSGE